MSPNFEANALFDINGLVAVVTGGGSGIGLMIAQGLEANGAIVYILGRRLEALESAALTAKHGNIHPIQADVTKKEDLERAVSIIRSDHGFVNVVIANSGISGPPLGGALPPNPSVADLRQQLWAADPAAFTSTYSVNATGVYYTAVAFLELLDEGNKRGNLKQRSQVIATASIGAFNRAAVAGYAYGSSKAATVHLMKQLATGWVPYNIRANVIAPGFYPSEMTANIMEKHNKTGWPKSIVPEERPGDEEDIVGAVLFLASKAGAYINGNVLVTDGGRLGTVPATY
ncbi:hypothetical protein BX600DRAFT_58259 [Xylariales sp. PMI_506]|nr:hypothetical protein BX600DRAFT_58259 [Xylariales sp. PMI_506]